MMPKIAVIMTVIVIGRQVANTRRPRGEIV